MSIGLDLGSTQFRSIRHRAGRLVGRHCRAESVSVPDSPGHRRLLDRDRVPYAEAAGTLHLLGDCARDWSRLLAAPLRRLLPDGQLPHDDPIGRQVLSLLVDAVLPEARIPQELCCLTVPGELLPTESSIEREFFLRLVRLRGYTPLVVGQGHAIALAEMGSAGYSGLGISLGATTSEFSLNRSGREIARCAIPWGSDELGLSGTDSGSSTTPPAVSADTLADFLVEILLEAGTRIEQHHGFRVLKQPVAIAVAGGVTASAGFQDVFERAWQRAAWPLSTHSITICPDSSYTIARGCLIRAVLEAQPESIAAAA